MPAASYVFLIMKRNKLKDIEVKDRIGTLYKDLKCDKNNALLFYALFFIHRLAYASILVFL